MSDVKHSHQGQEYVPGSCRACATYGQRTKAACCYCGSTAKELRPYGPHGAWTCFDCAMGSPERRREAETAFKTMLDDAERQSGVAVIGSEDGPAPFGKADA